MPVDQIAWFPILAGASVVGLVFTFLTWRRRGALAAARVLAWSLLPMAAYLTGAFKALWTVGSTLVSFVAGLVLNPLVWAGVILAGISAVLFVVTGVLRGRKLAKADRLDAGGEPAVSGRARKPAVQAAPKAAQQAQRPQQAQQAQKPVPQPAAAQTKKKPAADDDFSDIEDILKRRGIN
ncbi:cellulose synthase [Nonomuraea soli]|uniref:Cellulose synthase n=1 Tax=Nonomuraea soli TaxID=1032476 RepID=A0A7W0CRY0_9ACTN|nr:cellulose synthase [Nonomuraea soli]MBA2896084.1 hypothetical protein [Nonomuraea soli]